jgi:hypothetical protein
MAGIPIIVAASNAPANWQAAADYQCDGTADQTEIQSAVADVTASGGSILLSPGTFNIAAAIVIDGNNDIDNAKTINLHGSGVTSTYINGASNINVILIRNTAKVDIGDFKLHCEGSGNGIASTGSATNYRAFWLSSFKNIEIVTDWSGTHTGWGMSLGSPFRSVFENIDMGGVRNGLKLYSEDPAFNPGDCTFTRMFIDLEGNNGVAYNINSPTGEGSMNQINFSMCEAIASGTGCTGILIDGAANSNYNRFWGTNLEQFDTLVYVQNGQGNVFEGNYVECRGVNGMTAFRAGASAWNNTFRTKFLYSANTVTVINDANTAVTQDPNIFEDIKVYADTGSTVNITRVNSTVTRQIVTEGPGTVSAGVKKFVAVAAPNAVITLADAATIATDASLGNHFRVTLGGNRTLGNPTNPTDGQKIMWEIIQDATGSRTIALGAKFALGTDISTVTLTTTANKRDFLGAVYNASTDKWYIVAFVKGY